MLYVCPLFAELFQCLIVPRSHGGEVTSILNSLIINELCQLFHVEHCENIGWEHMLYIIMV
jgi:hypothetical protein